MGVGGVARCKVSDVGLVNRNEKSRVGVGGHAREEGEGAEEAGDCRAGDGSAGKEGQVGDGGGKVEGVGGFGKDF